MARKRRKPKPARESLFGGYGTPWQSSEINTRSYMMYRDWIMSLAMMRYRWVGLPDSCDRRYLEWTLLTQGVATIAQSESGIWASTQVAALSPPNVYDNYTSWQSFGNNGWRFPVTPESGVMVWSNRLRFPEWNQIDLFARRLAKLDRVMDCNLTQQQVTKIVTVPQEQYNDLVQIAKQNVGGEAYILGLKGLMKDFKVEVLGMETPYIGEELQTSREKLWQEVFSFLGIENVTHKTERMLVDEISAANAPVNLRALDGLEARRDACRDLNEYFGMECNVYWFEDVDTENFKTFQSIKGLISATQMGGGANGNS